MAFDTNQRFILNARFSSRVTLQLGRFPTASLAEEAVENVVLFLNTEHAENKTGWVFEKRYVHDRMWEVIRRQDRVNTDRYGRKLPDKGGLYLILIVVDTLPEGLHKVELVKEA